MTGISMARRGATAAARRRSANASGIPLPGAVPGWTLLMAEDFDTDFAVGAVSAADPGGGQWTTMPAPYNTNLKTYPDFWGDTADNDPATFPPGSLSPGVFGSFYRPSQVLEVTGSKLVHHLHINNGDFPGYAQSATLVLTPGGVGAQLYGRYSACFRVPTSFPGWKTAWLLWPLSNNWPTDGEIDFLEGGINSNIDMFMHRQGGASGADQDGYSSGVPFVSTGLGGGWHVVTLEWSSGSCKFILDGVTVGTSTSAVPNTSMYCALQTETNFAGYPSNMPEVGDAGTVEIDWVAMWSKP